MRPENIHMMVCNIRLQPIYTCRRCRKRQVGDTLHIQYTGSYPGHLDTMIRRHPMSSHSMPVGWASFPEGFLCQSCMNPSNGDTDQ